MILSNISQLPRCLKPALASVLRTWHDFVVVPETASPSAWRGRHADGKLFSARGRGRVYVCVCVCTPERETESLSRTVFTYRRYRPIGIRQSGKSNGGQKASEIIVEAIKLSPLSSLNRSILSLSLSLSHSIRDHYSSLFPSAGRDFGSEARKVARQSEISGRHAQCFHCGSPW